MGRIDQNLSRHGGNRSPLPQRQRKNGHIDGTTHRRADPHVGVVTRASGQFHGKRHELRWSLVVESHNLLLPFRRLVTNCDPAGSIGDGVADPRRSHGIEGVHRRHQSEAERRLYRAKAWDMRLALLERGDENIECFLRDAVEFLEIEDRSLPQGPDQRTLHKRFRPVATVKDHRRVIAAQQPIGRQFGVSFDEHKAGPGGLTDDPQEARFACPGWALENDMTPGVEDRGQYLGLPIEADDLPGDGA